MKPSLLLITLTTLVFGSCTSAYKTGQTPDDVYFSPAPANDEYVSSRNYDDNKYNDEYYDDRYLRMKVHDRTMWSELDDWYYPGYYNYYSYYSPYGYNYYLNPYGYNNYYGGFYITPYPSWNNYYYNPYCAGYVIVNTKSSVSYNKPRMVNLNTYSPNTNPNHTSIFRTNNSGNTYVPSPKYGNSGSSSGSGTGNFLRNIFNGGNSSGSSSSGKRSSSSGSSSSGSSGSKSSSAPVRKF